MLARVSLQALLLYLQGRTFDRHVLDMVEFGVEAYQPTESFPVRSLRWRLSCCVLWLTEMLWHSGIRACPWFQATHGLCWPRV